MSTRELVVYFIISLLNVILQTAKSIGTIQGGKGSAAIINAVTYGFYTIVLKQVSSYPLSYSIVVMVSTNLIGVYLVKYLVEKLRKERLWKITVVIRDVTRWNIEAKLKEKRIEYVVFNLPKSNKLVYDIYSNSQLESAYIKEILKDVEGRISVIEIDKKL